MVPDLDPGHRKLHQLTGSTDLQLVTSLDREIGLAHLTIEE